MLLPNCPLSDGSQHAPGHSGRPWALFHPLLGRRCSWTDRFCHSDSPWKGHTHRLCILSLQTKGHARRHTVTPVSAQLPCGWLEMPPEEPLPLSFPGAQLGCSGKGPRQGRGSRNWRICPGWACSLALPPHQRASPGAKDIAMGRWHWL